MTINTGPNLGIMIDGLPAEAHYAQLMAALRGIDALVQCRVLDKDLVAPPGSPINGAMYIPAVGASGAWSGLAGRIVRYYTAQSSGPGWESFVPKKGWRVHVEDEDVDYQHDGSAWVVATGGGGLTNPMTTLGDMIRGATSGVPERIPVGTNGQVMTVVAGEPEWADPAGGGFSGGTLTSALNEAPAATIASASTVNIGAASANTISITGTTTITAFDSIADGAVRLLEFAGALILTHNATSLILPTGANIVTAAGDVAEFRSLGSGNWRCVGYLRADGTPLAGGGGGGGLTNLIEEKNIALPNDVKPVVSLSVTITETHGDVAIIAKGTGATLAHVPTNGTAAGGNKRGNYATDFQKSRGTAAQVASGAYAVICGGRLNQASGQEAIVVGGQSNLASASQTVIVGGQSNTASSNGSSILGGENNTASGLHASVLGGSNNVADASFATILGGSRAIARGIYGAEARASGAFGTSGDAQRGRYIKRRATTSATPATLGTDGLAGGGINQVILPNNSAYVFTGKVVARENATGDCASWKFEGLIRRGANAASTALVAAVTPTPIAADAGAAAWVLAVSADTTNGGIAVTVTGEASHTIRWVADIETVEVVS